MQWTPNVTVAAIIQQDDRFLMVEEMSKGRQVYNQPAGHLEANETLVDAVIREVLEETAWQFTPEAVTGIYRMHVDTADTTFLRISFSGSVDNHEPGRELDSGIIHALWLSRQELQREQDYCRSPLVLQCIDDYIKGQRYPLEILHDLGHV